MSARDVETVLAEVHRAHRIDLVGGHFECSCGKFRSWGHVEHSTHVAAEQAAALRALPTGDEGECDHPGIEHMPFLGGLGICPKCRRCKFVGHGPLCSDCHLTTPPAQDPSKEFAEGAASVAGPVLALAEEWGSTPDDRMYDGDRARHLRAAIPTDATEALARLKAEWQAEALREARDEIAGCRREFGRLGADDWYLRGLDDAFGLVANRAREAQQDGDDRG